VDGAILDLGLRGARAYDVAERLIARRTPFVFVTGYDAGAHGRHGVPTIQAGYAAAKAEKPGVRRAASARSTPSRSALAAA
jgi:hypothetical protein